MRILRIADVADDRFGGMTRVMHLTTEPMVSDGNYVLFLFRDAFGLRVPGQLRRFFVPLQIVRQVRRRIRSGEQFDVVEIHEPLAAAYCAARSIFPALPPVVVLSHGLEARARDNFLSYRNRLGLRVATKSRYSPLTVVWQANFALRHADAVVCSTTEDYAYLRNKLSIAAERIHFINWGVLPQYFADPPARRSGILCHGSWIERKGIRDLVPAVTPLLKANPNLHLTISGCGFPRDFVAGHFPASAQPQLRIIDVRIAEEELIDLYLSHSIFVCPSFFEGQLLTLLEAAAAGLAIVTTNIGGMKDFIRPNENGLLHEPGDRDMLAQLLARLVRDEVQARRFGDAAREDARRFTWDGAAGKLLDAYRRAMGRVVNPVGGPAAGND